MRGTTARLAIPVLAGLVGAWLALGASLDAAPPAQPPPYEGSCGSAGCHDDLLRRKVLHAPAREEACDACHDLVDEEAHRFELTSEGAELCTACHDAFEGKVVHSPVEEGECTACHDPHGSAGKHLLLEETVKAQCTQCHDDPTEGAAFIHGPVAVDGCTLCHDPHAAPNENMLRKEGSALCTACHTGLLDRIEGAAYTHEPVRDDCTSCHDPHGAKNESMLRETPPVLCLECHADVGEEVASAPVKHKPATAEGSCAECHEPHAGPFERLLKDEPMDLCLRCHGGPDGVAVKNLTDMRKLLADNPDHHGPIRDKDCTACHLPHGGENFRLLVEAYPSKFYAPYSEDRYALCFMCHDAEAFREERTDTLTEFRNADRNLHYLHVNKKGKGRTCRACHETHASRRPRHIRESVPFGSWEIPIRFRKTDSGGSCSPGCHRTYRYDRDRYVENIR